MAVVETETLHGKFFKNAWNEPERVALICGEQKISYRDLRIYALQAANHLRQQGVKKGDKVVVNRFTLIL